MDICLRERLGGRAEFNLFNVNDVNLGDCDVYRYTEAGLPDDDSMISPCGVLGLRGRATRSPSLPRVSCSLNKNIQNNEKVDLTGGIVAVAAVHAVAERNHRASLEGGESGFIGDSITDPGAVPDNHDWTGRDDIHYWGYLQKWLGIRPFVYGVSGRQWNDVVNRGGTVEEGTR